VKENQQATRSLNKFLKFKDKDKEQSPANNFKTKHKSKNFN
jgi:hypothetical protein